MVDFASDHKNRSHFVVSYTMEMYFFSSKHGDTFFPGRKADMLD